MVVLEGLTMAFSQLSVVEYDPGTHDLKTLSLHYFEEPELRVGFELKTRTFGVLFTWGGHLEPCLGLSKKSVT